LLAEKGRKFAFVESSRFTTAVHGILDCALGLQLMVDATLATAVSIRPAAFVAAKSPGQGGNARCALLHCRCSQAQLVVASERSGANNVAQRACKLACRARNHGALGGQRVTQCVNVGVKLLEGEKLANLARSGQHSASPHCGFRDDEAEFLPECQAVLVPSLVVIVVISLVAAIVHYCDTGSGLCSTKNSRRVFNHPAE
jgi:hypothetical protein